jgi:hypothetical protein
MTSLLKDSAWMGPVLLSLIVLDIKVFIVLVSWIYVIFKTRTINKKEQPLFDGSTGPVYKTKIIWAKVIALTVSFMIAKIGVEVLHFLTWLLSDPSVPFLSVIFEATIKWMAFIQYFSFYRVYLYLWMALGSYVDPLMKSKGTPEPSSENPESCGEKDKDDSKKSQ